MLSNKVSSKFTLAQVNDSVCGKIGPDQPDRVRMMMMIMMMIDDDQPDRVRIRASEL